MNKQEAIEYIKRNSKKVVTVSGNVINAVSAILAISSICQIDEKSKVVIPQFVADWIEVCKENLTHSLYTAMTPNFMKENGQSFDLILWIKKASNQETFARAWLDGYEVEKEKRYVVTDGNHLYLKEYKDVGIIAISNKISESTRYIKKFENKDEAQKVADVLGWKVQEVKI